MATKKRKFYVVWRGRKPGVYETWDECKSQVHAFPSARFLSFGTRREAIAAFQDSPDNYSSADKKPTSSSKSAKRAAANESTDGSTDPVKGALCVDAAWNTDTKVMEYQGVWLDDRSLVFRQGPYENGTNNLGEFLAIVHALALAQQQQLTCPIYSDSQVAIGWVRKKRVNSQPLTDGTASTIIQDLVRRALQWLEQNDYANALLKWETHLWGENPADFGRK